MNIHVKSVHKDTDMDAKFHIRGKPGLYRYGNKCVWHADVDKGALTATGAVPWCVSLSITRQDRQTDARPHACGQSKKFDTST